MDPMNNHEQPIKPCDLSGTIKLEIIYLIDPLK